MKDLQKAYEITNAKIQFVSLVDKAANKKQFLITKAEDGQAQFTSFGRIVKTDEAQHYITGIVYEPLVEDAHGNYMTEEEITKAAYYFTKNGNGVDLQHSFETLEKAAVVESWVAKSDFKIDGTEIKKGTWLLTAEINDDAIWEAVEKGELTGFSMGGVGRYSEEDTDLDNVSKNESGNENTEKKGVLKKLASFFGMDVVEKGAFTDEYNKKTKSTLFWNAFYTLEDLLYKYSWGSDKWEFEEDETVIKEALEEFSSIIQDILSTEKNISKALATDKPVKKAGKKISGKNKETLTGIYDSLGTFLKEFDEDEETEETEMNEKDIQKMIDDSIAKALNPQAAQPAATPNVETITTETITKMVEDAVKKAMTPEETPAEATAENLEQTVTDAVQKAMAPILAQRGISQNLNGEPITKSQAEPHYMSGMF